MATRRQQVLHRGGLKAKALGFVGHSTGGLDVRMLLTPGLRILRGDAMERIARLTHTAISIATPHHGTPLAIDLLKVQGQRLLQLLSALATTGQGRGTLVAAARVTAMVAKLDPWLGRRPDPLDPISDALPRRLRFDNGDPVRRSLDELERDQGAVRQLTAEGIALFDASAIDRPGVDHACVVAAVPKPRGRLTVQALPDPECVALRELFRRLHALTSRPHPHCPYPKPAPAVQRTLDRAFGFETRAAVHDGIVPTLSQLHGRVLHVARSDHLEVAGLPTLAEGKTADRLPSGAGFTIAAFESTWDTVASAIALHRRPTMPA